MKRIRAEMEKVIQETGFQGSFEEFLKFLRTDPKFYYTKPEDLLTGYRDICKRIDAGLPALFGIFPVYLMESAKSPLTRLPPKPLPTTIRDL